MIDKNSPYLELEIKSNLDPYIVLNTKMVLNGFVNFSQFDNQQDISDNIEDDKVVLYPKIGVLAYIINVNTHIKIFEHNNGIYIIKITFTDNKIKVNNNDLIDLAEIFSDHFQDENIISIEIGI